MSLRDPPLWARGVAAGLLLFASWWLLNTESIRVVIGDSIGALCLGVIAASILQGMHLPLGIWPEGPWRKQFSVPAVVGTSVLLAAMILVAKIAVLDAVVSNVDWGTGIIVVTGAVGLGFAAGFVRQRRYLAWYGYALLLGILPFISHVTIDLLSANGGAGPLCYFSVPENEIDCNLALVPSLVFLTSINVAGKLVTEEIAFRRLLIGVAVRSGLLSVILSCVVAFCWYQLLSYSGIGDAGTVILGTLGALSAGAIYVLSRSLVVSALFSAVYAASHASLSIAATSLDAPFDTDARSIAFWGTTFGLSVVLATLVARKNGFFGNLKEKTSTNVTRN